MEQLEKTHNESAHGTCQHGCGCGASDEGKIEKVQKAEVERQSEPERAYVPAVDIIDSEKETVLVIDIPGVEDKNVDLSVEKSILTIHAKPVPEAFEGKTLVYSEYGVGDYRRSFSLSDDISRDGITASIKDGVLEVRLPKSAPVTKKIAVGSH